MTRIGSPIQLSTSWLGQAAAERDIIAELLADKRSEGTRLAYAKDLLCSAEISSSLSTFL